MSAKEVLVEYGYELLIDKYQDSIPVDDFKRIVISCMKRYAQHQIIIDRENLSDKIMKLPNYNSIQDMQDNIDDILNDYTTITTK